MIGDYLKSVRDAWNHFWFVPRSAETLALIRILVGAMLLYTHCVWTVELSTFFGSDSIIPTQYRHSFLYSGGASWSHFDWSASSGWLWGSHVVALVTFAMFTLGWFTRVTAILSFLFVVSYANRATGALFGLDQISAFLTLYLAISHCGSRYSLDEKFSAKQGRAVSSVANNIATRLIQIHMCIVYLFAGTGKLAGPTWWNGEAIWGTLASYEYQTFDMTWIAGVLWLVNLLTYATVAWEISYSFLIWSKLTRPLVLAFALFTHLGIGIAMGMMTFGLVMLFGNLAFVSPGFTASVFRRFESGREVLPEVAQT